MISPPRFREKLTLGYGYLVAADPRIGDGSLRRYRRLALVLAVAAGKSGLAGS